MSVMKLSLKAPLLFGYASLAGDVAIVHPDVATVSLMSLPVVVWLVYQWRL